MSSNQSMQFPRSAAKNPVRPASEGNPTKSSSPTKWLTAFFQSPVNTKRDLGAASNSLPATHYSLLIRYSLPATRYCFATPS